MTFRRARQAPRHPDHRGRLPACSCLPPTGGPPTKTERPQRFPQRDHPIKHHVAGPGANPRVVDRSKAGRPRAHDPLSHQPCARTSRARRSSTRQPRTTRLTCGPCTSKEQRSALRAAVYRGDGRAVVERLGGVGAGDDSLQLAGDGLIAVVMQRVDGAAELARKFVVGLRQRGWEGDDELADQLEAQLGSGPAAMLRALPVDLEELAGILEGDPLSVGGRIDIRTGEVWSQAAIDYALETGEEDEDTSDDPERWLAVHGEGSREGYRDMELQVAVRARALLTRTRRHAMYASRSAPRAIARYVL
jgi:hypothetical protein